MTDHTTINDLTAQIEKARRVNDVAEAARHNAKIAAQQAQLLENATRKRIEAINARILERNAK